MHMKVGMKVHMQKTEEHLRGLSSPLNYSEMGLYCLAAEYTRYLTVSFQSLPPISPQKPRDYSLCVGHRVSSSGP